MASISARVIVTVTTGGAHSLAGTVSGATATAMTVRAIVRDATAKAIDGVSILNDTHPYGPGGATWDNKVTTAFSPAALNAGVVAMTSLKTEAGMPYGMRPDTLMVEPTNERDAKDAIGVMRPIPVYVIVDKFPAFKGCAAAIADMR